MKFAGPNWYVPLHLATGFWECGAYQMPRHYLMKFDPRYNHNYKDFGEFDIKNQFSFNPDLPTLCPWRLSAIQDSGFRMVLDRNPYYYMTDTAGRQLPYIDRIIVEYVPDPQIRVLKVLAGEIDAQFYDQQLSDIGLYVRGEKTGHYHVLRWQTGAGADEAFMVNWSPPDSVLRSLFRDVRFRKALSLAIDRDKINQLALHGLDKPQQATISAAAWHFRVPGGRKAFDDWAKAYAQFDIPAANQLLNEMGLTKRDSGGYRLRPDGKRLSLLIDLPPAATEDISVDESQTVEDGWRRLGIDVSQHNFSSAQFSLRQILGTFQISPLGESEMDLFTYPGWVFPTTEERWHGAVGKWYTTGGKQGEPPTGVCKQLIDIYNQIMAEKDLAKAHQLVLKAVRLETKEGFFCLGTVGDEPALLTIKDNFRNVPPTNRILGPWAIASPASSYPETFFFSSEPSSQQNGKGSN
jgi:peptide/nickel transport system substrate-binding protein